MPSVPSDLSTRATRQGAALAAGAIGGLLLLIVLPPFVGSTFRAALMAGFSFVCHQLPGRSLHLHGLPLAVCHRCLGIFMGLFAAGLLFPLLAHIDRRIWRYSRWVIFLSLVPMGLDWGGDFLGLFSNVPVSRVLTGAIFGLAGGYFLARGLAGLFLAAPAQAAETPSPRYADAPQG